MKKLVLLLVAVLLIPMMFLNVFATSVPYEWIVDGETVNAKSNEAGTARLEKNGLDVTLYLKNYSGGQLKLNCYGTGQPDVKFYINLEGENKITASDVGIEMGSSKVEFNGEGTLVINAPKPISSEDAVDVYKVNIKEEVTEPQETKDAEEDDEKPSLISAPEEEKQTETKKDNSNDTLVRVLGCLVLVCIGVISFLVVKITMLKKKDTQN